MTLLAFIAAHPFATLFGLGIGTAIGAIGWAWTAADYEGR